VPDDFVLNVRQITQYPQVDVVDGRMFMLVQLDIGGPYQSIGVVDAVATALQNQPELDFNLGTGTSIQWGLGTTAAGGSGFVPSAALAFNGSSFTLSAPLSLPGLSSASDIFVNGEALASQDWVQGLFDALVLQNQVFTFNGRTGNVQLEDVDILRAGGVLQTNPTFNGVVTAPTLWNPFDQSDSVATTAFVHMAICAALNAGGAVTSYNGRTGAVVPIADDVTAALTVPGTWGYCNTPVSGDVSKKIANCAFVDGAIADMQTYLEGEMGEIASNLDQQFAPLNSPQFTGIPTAPTAAQTVNSGQLATTAFVHAAVTASTSGVASFNGRTGAVTLTTADVTNAGGAPLAAPAFTGNATAVTQAPGDNSTRIATTAFVEAAVAGVAAGVTTFNGRSGAVTLAAADVTGVGGALLASPAFSGTPTAPTAAPATNNTQVATTAFVAAAITALPAPVTSFNGRTGSITFQASDISAVNGALLASPAFSGVPTVPTAAPGTSNLQAASTAFVAAAVAASVSGVSTFNSRSGAVTLLAADVTGVGGALLSSPAFVGTPSGPTATAGTNSSQLATTAFVQAALSAAPGGVSSFNGRTGAISLLAADVSAVGGALTASPAFSGTPTAPTAAIGTNTSQIATTQFVMNQIATAGGVNTFNGRAGAVTLANTDIVGVTGGVLLTVAAGTPPSGTLATGNQAFWWDSQGGNLYLSYNDGNSTQWVAATAPVPTPNTGPLGIQKFTASGTYTPTAGMRTCIVECVGGGAGGVGAYNAATTSNTGGGGGGSGAYSKRLLTAQQVGASQTVTIGAGGAGGVGTSGVSTPGAPGGATSFGTLVVANGGQASGSGLAGGTGGSTTGAVGDVTLVGNPGGPGMYGAVSSSVYANSGFGGNSMLGAGAQGLAGGATSQGGAATGPGGGGSGSVLFNVATFNTGGNGAAGICIITEYA